MIPIFDPKKSMSDLPAEAYEERGVEVTQLKNFDLPPVIKPLPPALMHSRKTPPPEVRSEIERVEAMLQDEAT